MNHTPIQRFIAVIVTLLFISFCVVVYEISNLDSGKADIRMRGKDITLRYPGNYLEVYEDGELAMELREDKEPELYDAYNTLYEKFKPGPQYLDFVGSISSIFLACVTAFSALVLIPYYNQKALESARDNTKTAAKAASTDQFINQWLVEVRKQIASLNVALSHVLDANRETRRLEQENKQTLQSINPLIAERDSLLKIKERQAFLSPQEDITLDHLNGKILPLNQRLGQIIQEMNKHRQTVVDVKNKAIYAIDLFEIHLTEERDTKWKIVMQAYANTVFKRYDSHREQLMDFDLRKSNFMIVSKAELNDRWSKDEKKDNKGQPVEADEDLELDDDFEDEPNEAMPVGPTKPVEPAGGD